MTEFTLNIKLCASEELLEAIRLLTGGTKQITPEATTKKSRKEQAVQTDQATTDTAKAESRAAETSTAETTITREDIRAAVQEKSGKKHEIKALLKEFGAENVTTLTEENFSAFLEKLNLL